MTLRNLGAAVAKTIGDMKTGQARTLNAVDEIDISMFRPPFKPEIYLEEEKTVGIH